MTRRSTWAVVGALLFTSVAVIAPAGAAVLTLVDGTHQLKFNRANGVTYFANSAGGTATAPAINSTLLYKNVVTVGGQSVDAAVTLTGIPSGSISNFDNPGSASTASGYNDFFQLNTVGGRATLRFDFYEAGTWTGTNTGIPVILQNVKIKSIDLDSSGTNGYQYSDFSGFQKYTMTTDTNLGVQSVAGTNLVRFIATKTGARSAVPQDQVLVKYDALSSMTVSFGNVVAGQTNYFGLTFGPWAEGGTPQEYTNGYNAAPTSSDVTQLVESAAATLIPKSSFGNYQDVDSNPFMQVKITQLETSGDLESYVAGNWSDVSTGQVLLVADIERGYLRFTGTQDATLKFLVQDGLDYSASDYTLTFQIVSAGQFIEFPNPGAKAKGDTFDPGAISKDRSNSNVTGLSVTLTSQTTGVCTVTNGVIEAKAVGTCIIVATQPGNGTYGAAAPVTQTFPITETPLMAQTITLPNPGDTSTGVAPFSANGTSTSSLPVTVSSLTPNVCTVSGSTITIVGPGTCTIRATQAGDGTYAPAVPVEVSFQVAAGAPLANTTAATEVSSTSATLNGSINGFGSSTTVTFCVSTSNSVNGNGALTCDVSTETATQSPVLISGTKIVSKSKSSGLSSGTTYFYQVIVNNGQTTYGNVVSFKAVEPGSTGAITKPVTSQSSAGNNKYNVTLPGTVTATGTWTATFCYKNGSSRPSTSDGRISGCTVASASSQPPVNPLNAGVDKPVEVGERDVVWYQVVATNGTETSTGRVLRFQVRGPFARTDAAESVTATTATVKGMVNRQSRDLDSVKFCVTATKPGDLETNPILSCNPTYDANGWNKSTSGDQNVYYNLSGLSEGTTYYFQVTAKTSRGTNYGQILEFTTTKPAPAPVAKTEPATAVSATSATLNGAVDPREFDATARFCFGTTATLTPCTEVAATQLSISGNSYLPVSAELSGLSDLTTYYFRVRATNVNGTDTGTIQSFTTGAPVALTSAATDVTASSAKLIGSVKPMGGSADVFFCFGTTNTATAGVLSTCSSKVSADPTAVTGSANYGVVLSRTGLTSGTTYYFQTAASKPSGASTYWSYGEIRSFTASEAPVAVTDAATYTASSEPVLNGRVSSKGSTTAVWFCYGLSATLQDGQLVGCKTAPEAGFSAELNALESGTAVSETLTATLKSGATYYYQVVAENDRGTVYGNVRTFVAPVTGPDAETDPADVGTTSVTLNGRVNPNGLSTGVRFCYATAYTVDTTTVEGSSILTGCTLQAASTETVTGTTEQPASWAFTNPTTNTTYYYQVRGTNSAGTAYGEVYSFRVGTPKVTTSAVDSITATTARFNGSFVDNGDTVTATAFCFVEGSTYSVGADNAISGCTAWETTTATGSSFTADVTGLTAGARYYLQARAIGTSQTIAYGNVVGFVAGRPSAVTGAVDSVTATTATLNGSVTANAVQDVRAYFYLSYSDEVDEVSRLLLDAQIIEINELINGDAPTSIQVDLESLVPSTTHYYQVVAVENGQDAATQGVFGTVKSFTTVGTATTDPATSTGETSTVLNGSSSVELTNPYFCISATSPISDPCTETVTATGNYASGYSASVSGRSLNTTYYFQFMGTSGGNLLKGDTRSFTTLVAGGPTATTQVAASVTQTTAVVNGSVSANRSRASVTFCVSDSAAESSTGVLATCRGGAAVAASPSTVDTSTTQAVLLSLSGLTAGSTYYFQVIAENSSAITHGAILSFTTSTASSGNSGGSRGGGAATPAVKRLTNPTKVLPKANAKTDTSIKTTEKKSTEAKLQPVVAKVLAGAPTTPGGSTTPGGNTNPTTPAPTVTLDNVTVLPEIKEQVAKKIKLEETTDGLKVTPVDGFTGRLVVPVITVANNEEVEVLTEVVVNPEPVPTGQATPESIKKSTVTWAPSTSQVVEYVVEINGKEACKTTSTSCDVSAVVGPKTKVEVTAIGNDQTISEQTAAQYRALQLIAAAKVQFAESSSKLRPAAKKVLQDVAKIIMEAGFTKVAIEGHTDSQGGQKNASPLSKARAVATQKYLDSLLPQRLEVKLKGSGLAKPVAPNDTKAGQAKNRRAEVLVG